MTTKVKGVAWEITQTVKCPLPGFEGVEITFDLMATPEQSSLFIRHMGALESHVGVVVKVEGWPEEVFGADPWDTKRVPVVWVTWAGKKALAQALEGYFDPPNS